jgi:hypothetical protein
MSAQRWLDSDGAGLAPARPAQIGGQVAGCRGPREPARSTAADPGSGYRLRVTELFTRVGGSSVTLTCCIDQGGRYVDMVVGADSPDRAGRGGVRDAGSSPPLTPRHEPGHGRLPRSKSAPAWRCGRRAHAQRAPLAAHRRPARQTRTCSEGGGQWRAATASNQAASSPWRWLSRISAVAVGTSAWRAAVMTASRSR